MTGRRCLQLRYGIEANPSMAWLLSQTSLSSLRSGTVERAGAGPRSAATPAPRMGVPRHMWRAARPLPWLGHCRATRASRQPPRHGGGSVRMARSVKALPYRVARPPRHLHTLNRRLSHIWPTELSICLTWSLLGWQPRAHRVVRRLTGQACRYASVLAPQAALSRGRTVRLQPAVGGGMPASANAAGRRMSRR